MTNLLLIVLFVTAITTFAIKFGDDNDSRINLVDSEYFNQTKVGGKAKITEFSGDVNTSTQALMSSTISSQTEATEGGTAYKVTPWSLVNALKTVVTAPYNTIFRTSSDDNEFGILFTAFFAIVGAIATLYIWKAWKGNPD